MTRGVPRGSPPRPSLSTAAVMVGFLLGLVLFLVWISVAVLALSRLEGAGSSTALGILAGVLTLAPVAVAAWLLATPHTRYRGGGLVLGLAAGLVAYAAISALVIGASFVTG